jgi:hypothetical protein
MVCAVMVSLPAQSDDISSAVLIDEIIKNPGPWKQMCGGFSFGSQPPIVPLFGYYRGHAFSKISEANFERLREQRDPVLQEISNRLDAITSKTANLVVDSTQRMLEQKANSASETIRIPRAPESAKLEIYLMFLLDLNGVEALPALLRLERALDQVALYRLPQDDWEWVRAHATYASPKQQNHVLSIITALLLYEEAEGLMDSAIFEAYSKGYMDLREQNKGTNMGSLIASISKDPPRDRMSIDEIQKSHAFDLYGPPGLNVELTQENRDLIVSIAEEFLKAKKPGDFRAAEAITPVPRPR